MDSSRIISCIATPIGRGQSDFMSKANNAYGSSSAPSLQKRINYSQGVYETMNGKQKKDLLSLASEKDSATALRESTNGRSRLAAKMASDERSRLVAMIQCKNESQC